jgi:phospholipase/lecithinase/hemolysin
MTKFASFILAAAAVLSAAAPVRAAVASLLVFGDSLSDTGNISARTFGFSPGSSYFQGRFSNGPIWIDRLATRYGIPAPTPSVRGGQNYAQGGARVSQTATFFILQVPSFQSQVASYVSSGPAVTASTLVTIWIGGNDFLNFQAGVTDPLALAATVESSMLSLTGKGARNFMLLNLPPIGSTPNIAGQGAARSAEVNAAVRQYNQRLAQIPTNLQLQVPGTAIRFVDTYSAFETAIASPQHLGLVNTSSPALIGGVAAPNANQYLWWDDVHPTSTGHQFLQLWTAVIPEPGMLVFVALAGMLTLRRR